MVEAVGVDVNGGGMRVRGDWSRLEETGWEGVNRVGRISRDEWMMQEGKG